MDRVSLDLDLFCHHRTAHVWDDICLEEKAHIQIRLCDLNPESWAKMQVLWWNGLIVSDCVNQESTVLFLLMESRGLYIHTIEERDTTG